MTIRDRFDKVPLPVELDTVQLQSLIQKVTKIGVDFFTQVDSYAQKSKTPAEINVLYQSEVPQEPLDIESIIDYINKMIPNMRGPHSKRFLAFVPSDPLPQSVALASVTALFNQFTGGVPGSPSGVAVEAMVIKWLCDLLGYPTSSFGSFTSGGSMANLTGIYTGIVYQMSLQGIDYHEEGLIGSKRPVFYFSDQTHNAVEKALRILGVGKKSMRVLPTNDVFELEAAIVKKAIEQDLEKGNLPMMIIGTAGTTNTGSVDHLSDLRVLADEFKLWFHIDGAYGAFTRISTHKQASKTQALPLADSLALDCHKWLYAPFEAGVALVRNHERLKAAFDLSAAYLVDSEMEEDFVLQRNFRSYSLQMSRELRGLKVWAVFAGLGVSGISNAITRDILKAEYFVSKLREHPKFSVIASSLSIVCSRYNGSEEDNIRILEALKERDNFFISSTTVRGKTAIRTCFLNRRSTLDDVDELIAELEQIVEEIEN